MTGYQCSATCVIDGEEGGSCKVKCELPENHAGAHSYTASNESNQRWTVRFGGHWGAEQ